MHKKITKCREHLKLPRARAWLRSVTLCNDPAVPFFKVVNQQPGTSRPTSWLRSSFAAVWMWRAFSAGALWVSRPSRSLWCLPFDGVVVCPGMFCHGWLLQHSPAGSLSVFLHPCLKPSGRLANVGLPAAAGIWYTTLDCSPAGSVSLTLVSTDQRDLLDFKITPKPNPLQTCLMSSLTPET